MSLHVRRAEPGDAEELVALASAVSAEPEGWLLADSRWRTVAEERRYIRALRRHPDGALIVAELEGTLVGRLSIARDTHPASPHVADLGLMVAAPYRRRGVATALLEAAEAWARSAGVSKLELHVFPFNTPALALYEKCGFEREGYRRRHYVRGDGTYVDAVLMAKRLPP
ncbi:MAG TPA: GNAT family N-acetyltransferase [Gaiellaceae bacterium]|nr:GNAT family N-acetyltransferase [Gaiellaceae bacterium]